MFISYAHADKDLAVALYQGLKENGLRVWIDQHELRIGDSLLTRIAEAVYSIDFFIALVSTASAESPWCQKELALASSGALNRNGLRVLPLRVDGAEMPKTLSDQLYLDISRADVSSAVSRLIADMAAFKAEENELQKRSGSNFTPDDEERLAYERVIKAGDPNSRALAATKLGDLLSDQDAREQAKEAYRLAIESGVERFSPYSMVRLAEMEKEDGNLEIAEDLLKEALASGDTTFEAFACLELGHVLGEQEKFDEAEVMYTRVIDRHDSGLTPNAAVGLGQVRSQQGNHQAAEAAFRLAIDSDDEDAKGKACANLGSMLYDAGKIDDAIAMYEIGAQTEGAEFAAVCSFMSGGLLEMQGRLTEAAAAYRRTVELDQSVSAWAAHSLADILAFQRDLDGAQSFYQLAIDKGDEQDAGKAQLALGMMLASVGRKDDAERTLKRATNCSDINIASAAFAVLDAIRRGSVPPKPWEKEQKQPGLGFRG